VHLAVGVFGFFQQRQYDQFSVTSNAALLDVRPLPPAPPGFGGAVGKFTLASKVVPETAAVGEPVTWTLTLTGTGNWPQIQSLPERSVSRDFQVVRPQVKRSPAPGKTFDASLAEDAVLVPTKPGHYTLPAVRFVYFDPATARYETSVTPTATLTIAPPAGGGGGSGTGSAATGANGPGALLVAPELPAGLPGDPLPTGATAPGPISGWCMVAGLGAAALIVIATWLSLAYRKARESDPRRAEREAHQRLQAILAAMRRQAGHPHGPAAGTNGTLRPELIAWQRESARLWVVSSAAPRADEFADREWSRLWAESEAALYGPSRPLPADWVDRAERSLLARPAPAFSARRMLAPRNLFPLWLLVIAVGPAARGAEDTALAAYRSGNFPAAEAIWRGAAPTDAAARYDLSLAFSQQRRWPEALAEAAAAFVQRPGDADIRRQFALACERAEISPGVLAPFVAPTLPYRAAAWLSPAEWQRALVICGAGVAVGAILLLLAAYGVVPRRRLAAAVSGAILIVAGIGGIGLSALAGEAYGPAGDPRAVLLWKAGTLRSIPSEADASQATVAVAAGLVGVEDRQFLGWVRLVFPNGETGWVRRAEVVPLWK
jgi:hypothetical protein